MQRSCTYCHKDEEQAESLLGLVFDQYDSYGIFAGRWHEQCWAEHGYADWKFDPSYAGESLEEEY